MAAGLSKRGAGGVIVLIRQKLYIALKIHICRVFSSCMNFSHAF